MSEERIEERVVGLEAFGSMPSRVTKRDGRTQPFDPSKITEAIKKAFTAVGDDNHTLALSLTYKAIQKLIEKDLKAPTVPQIQEIVENTLMEAELFETARAYVIYRNDRDRIREANTSLMQELLRVLKTRDQENANVNGDAPMGKMLKGGSEAMKGVYLSHYAKPEHSKAHRDGYIHIHDADFAAIGTTTCLQIPLDRLLREGFNTGHGWISPPKSIESAASLSCIIFQSNQNDQHGGQSYVAFDNSMVPYVKKTFDKVKKELEEVGVDEDLEEKVWKIVRKRTYQAMQIFVFNLNTMHSRAGAQVPFTSVNFGLDTTPEGRLVIEMLLKVYKKGLGKGETPIFPNLIFSLAKGINKQPGDPNYDLRKLAHEVSCERLFPNYSNQDASFNAPYFYREEDPQIIAYMGCRTRVISNRDKDSEVTEGRGNLSFTSINLPRLALESDSLEEFYDKLKETHRLVVEQLYDRYRVQISKKVKEFPFLMGQKLYLDSEGLELEDKLEKPLKHGTLSIGFIGLAEALKVLKGEHHGESYESFETGLRIVEFMDRLCKEASGEYNLNFSLLATPAEGLSGRFTKLDREKFGVVPEVNDKDWYTNSFHIPVEYPISAYEKIKRESAFNKYTPAGHINYVELDAAPKGNIEAFERLVDGAVENDCGYFSVNFPVDQCLGCNHNGVIDEKSCPVCGSKKIQRVRRVTGYLGVFEETLDEEGETKISGFNDGKFNECKNRVAHLKGYKN
ncbi:anaerobic ribonucleoside-triphosphate reductase [Natranaerofaba carboxydovora]|uniref:anaerobic ribonucleoside-triphosphate reductase n=1 Tax=Natranaerofaba carboxydovora TaxID=2742683 RepID=UPI001F12C3B5|nr:anaerobic ribonucleoside-triphosphate reductase [Natranaerofaba carboxydovora]UMZ75324.1 Anaerobic ribonucleoside-triphosphate reductase [Natranaerofaba carboxydovora]